MMGCRFKNNMIIPTRNIIATKIRFKICLGNRLTNFAPIILPIIQGITVDKKIGKFK